MCSLTLSTDRAGRAIEICFKDVKKSVRKGGIRKHPATSIRIENVWIFVHFRCL